MSKRHWFAATALGLIATLGAAQEQTATENQPDVEESAPNGGEGTETQQPASIDPTPALNGIETAIRDLVTEVDEIERRAEQDRANRDLSAQEAMAHWAMLMFWATATTVLLTFAALLAILRTLHHTRRAADYAEDMVGEAKRATEVQVRAYVNLGEVIVTNARAQERPKLKLKIKNFGASPALNLRVKCKFAFGPAGQIRVFFREQDFMTKAGVGPGAMAEMSGEMRFPMREQEVVDLDVGKSSMTVAGYGAYETVFGKTHRFTFNMISVGRNVETRSVHMIVASQHNHSN